MSIPKYPFVVSVHTRVGQDTMRQTHNYETLAGAAAYASAQIRKPPVRSVRISVVIEEMLKADWPNNGGQ